MKLLCFVALFFATGVLAQPPIVQKNKPQKTATKKCASCGEEEKLQKRMIMAKDDGKTIKVKVKQQFDILFKNECIGCRDVWTNNLIDTTKVKFLSNSYGKKSCTKCVGGKHDNTFHFKAIKTGKSTLSFVYFDSTFSVKIWAK